MKRSIARGALDCRSTRTLITARPFGASRARREPGSSLASRQTKAGFALPEIAAMRGRAGNARGGVLREGCKLGVEVPYIKVSAKSILLAHRKSVQGMEPPAH